MDGFVVTQLLYVASELGLAEALADGPRTGAELAAAVDADAGALTRVLRGLALEDVVSEQDGRFALTPVGEALVPMAGALRARGQVYYGGAAGLLDAVRHGGTAFERTYGAPFFDHLAAHPEQEAAFQASMAGRSEQEAGDVVAAYDFSGPRRAWSTSAAVAASCSRRSSLPRRTSRRRSSTAPGRSRRRASTSPPRASRATSSTSVPMGADAYLLSRVLHDWDDEDALRILAVCRAAMHAAARLLVVDAILPERAKDAEFAIRMDLHMLLLLGARERTEAEFRALLGEAGFEVRRVVPTRSPAGLSVIEAVRAP